MNFRTRLVNWSLPVLLFGVPLCAALALEHAGAAGEKDRSRNRPSQRVEIQRPMPAAPAAAGPKLPESSRPLSR
jgi:hypothetical protein